MADNLSAVCHLFWNVPLAVGLTRQKLCSPIGNPNFRNITKQSITTEEIPHSVDDSLFLVHDLRTTLIFWFWNMRCVIWWNPTSFRYIDFRPFASTMTKTSKCFSMRGTTDWSDCHCRWVNKRKRIRGIRNPEVRQCLGFCSADS